jgi:class 3 adenylate cyclase
MLQAAMNNASLNYGVNASLLDARLSELERVSAWSPRLVSKLEALIASKDPWALFRINPVQFAQERGLAEAEAIDLFLHAARLGLFKIEWHLICPSCADAVESFSSLSRLHSKFNCRMCNLEGAAQLDDYIEVSFTVLPAVRDCSFHHPEALSIEDLCLKYHFHLPAKFSSGGTFPDMLRASDRGMRYLEPLSKISIELKAEPGFITAFDLISNAGFLIVVNGEPADQIQVLKLKLGGSGFEPEQNEVRPGPVRVEVKNRLARRGALMVGQHGPNFFSSWVRPTLPPFLGANRLLNSQTFRKLFGAETLGGDEGIGVRDLALLFTDLKGSTALYERIGDLKAFALVQQHFRYLAKAVQDHDGAVVKTIGDAVMASFNSASDAVAASLEMFKEIEAFNRSQEFREILLKVGVHRGPAIAVTLNERLDYFGQSVNIAARVQGLAGAEEICLTEAVWKAPGVREQLKGLQASPESASLRGVSQSLRVYRVSERTKFASSLKPSKKRQRPVTKKLARLKGGRKAKILKRKGKG